MKTTVFEKIIKRGPSLYVTTRIGGHNSENFATEFNCWFMTTSLKGKKEKQATNVLLNLHFQQANTTILTTLLYEPSNDIPFLQYRKHTTSYSPL
jgi:hypothetical protein